MADGWVDCVTHECILWFRMRVENLDQVDCCHMATPDLPPITEDRIGLRYMFTRLARYQNMRIRTPEEKETHQ